MAKVVIVFVVITLNTVVNSIIHTKPPVCCTPDQWEAHMFWDNGNAFIDAQSGTSTAPGVGTVITYINGSLTTAYDFTNGRTFINATIMQISPLIPKPAVEQTILIRDYKNGVEYKITGSKCEKSQLDPLKRHCIPGEAVNLGPGTVGKQGVPVSNFAYTLTDYPYQFQSTVTQKGCLPVHVMYLVASSEAGSGAVYSLEVLDVTPGIKDPSVFDVPPQCKNRGQGMGNTTMAPTFPLTEFRPNHFMCAIHTDL